MENWDYTTDFLVVGSGAGAMAGAIRAKDLGADVLVIEKCDMYGGTSAMSGGALWVPDNHLMAEKGIKDSEEEAREYLKAVISKGHVEARVDRYIEKAKQVVKYLCENTQLQFTTCAVYPDYYPELKGGKSGGRTIEPLPFNAFRLGEEREKLRPVHPQMWMLGSMLMTGKEAQIVGAGGIRSKLLLLKIILCHFLNIPARLKSFKTHRLTLGNSLVSPLRLSLMQRDVPLWLNTSAQKLITEDGKVIGIEVINEGITKKIRTNKGVLLACGGFERNLEMRKKYQGDPSSDQWSAANLGNQGDGIRLGMDIGADVALMEESWWMPTLKVPEEQISFVIVFEKSIPGTIIVSQEGTRYINEAAPYDDVGKSMREETENGLTRFPSYLIFDSNYRKRYPIGNIQPSSIQPDKTLSERQTTECLLIANSIEELADKINIPATTLKSTIDNFNSYAEQGIDPDFKRGQSIYDRYYSVPAIKPNPNLGPIATGPFYAVKLNPGDLGTKGGLVADRDSRVLDKQGNPIKGLYCSGNCSASVMGNAYPGAGATLGPAVTFSFIAAEHAAS